MAEPNVLVEELRNQVKDLKLEWGAQRLIQKLKPYGGEPKEFDTWIRDLEKVARLTTNSLQRIKMMAYETATGPVSTFIERYLLANAEATWDELKAELTSRFGEITDPAHAIKIMRKTKQKSHEGIQAFSERLLELAGKAFPDANLNENAYSMQLIEIFTDGLLSNAVAKRVIRGNPKTFAEAVAVATTEQNMLKRIEVRHRYETPMEIDKFEGVCFKCHKSGHRAQECRMSQTHKFNDKTNFNGRCFNCQAVGHKARNCRVRVNRTYNSYPPTKPHNHSSERLRMNRSSSPHFKPPQPRNQEHRTFKAPVQRGRIDTRFHRQNQIQPQAKQVRFLYTDNELNDRETAEHLN